MLEAVVYTASFNSCACLWHFQSHQYWDVPFAASTFSSLYAGRSLQDPEFKFDAFHDVDKRDIVDAYMYLQGEPFRAAAMRFYV